MTTPTILSTSFIILSVLFVLILFIHTSAPFHNYSQAFDGQAQRRHAVRASPSFHNYNRILQRHVSRQLQQDSLTKQALLLHRRRSQPGHSEFGSDHSRPSGVDNVRSLTPKRLIWHLHFHKAAGTSFSQLAEINGEAKCAPPLFPHARNDIHSHLELGIVRPRWPLILSNPLHVPIPALCQRRFQKMHWRVAQWIQNRSPEQVIRDEVQRLADEGVSYVSTEMWFPDLQTQPIPKEVVKVVIFREPIRRLLSSYRFHGCGGRRCQRDTACSFQDWEPAERNLYTKLLNGRVFGPLVIEEQNCSIGYALEVMQESHYENALRTLLKFELVLTLESMTEANSETSSYQNASTSQHPFRCALQKVLGWKDTDLPKENQNLFGIEACPANISSIIEKSVFTQVRNENKWDIMLYEHAKRIQAELFNKLGCVITL